MKTINGFDIWEDPKTMKYFVHPHTDSDVLNVESLRRFNKLSNAEDYARLPDTISEVKNNGL
jgi:hypothetical protein